MSIHSICQNYIIFFLDLWRHFNNVIACVYKKHYKNEENFSIKKMYELCDIGRGQHYANNIYLEINDHRTLNEFDFNQKFFIYNNNGNGKGAIIF